MVRLLAVLIGVVSATILLAELVGVGYLWSKGFLSPDKLQEMRQVFKSEPASSESEEDGEAKSAGSSQQDVQAARVIRVLDLESRSKELELLKTMTSNTANQLISERKTFDEIRAAFRTELAVLSQRHQQEAVEQARAVLLASPNEAAVERLMALPLMEAIDLVRGMPDKSVAKILQGFTEPLATVEKTEERKQRGQQIFEAISRGQPVREAIEQTLSQIPEGAAESPPGGG